MSSSPNPGCSPSRRKAFHGVATYTVFPTPEHQRLKEIVGKWNVKCTYFMGGSEPMETQAVDTAEMLGEFWCVSRFDSNMMGMPFKGQAVSGYNPTKGKWVSTWIDSMTSYFALMEGEVDPDTGLLVMRWDSPNMGTGEMDHHRSETEHRADGSTMTFYMGEDVKTMVIEMKRKAGTR